MAQTVKVEIPIEATDKTASGVSSAQRRFDALERSIEKTQKKIDKMNGSHCKVGLDASDTASDKIASVDDALQKTNGKEANVDVGAHDAASGVLNSVEDAASELNGEEAVVDAEAEDAATGVLDDVNDTLSELNGEQAVVEVEAEDAATGVINEVDATAEELNGKTVSLIIQAEDAATGQIQNAASGAKGQLGALAGVMGASFGIYDSVSTYGGFEAAMSQVKAISGATGDAFDQLTEKAKYMGATTKFTATESAEAFNYMAMAGWKTDEMLNGIEGVMNLAAASGENLGTTSDIVTDALTAFGMKASDSTHFADVMAQASANANTNVSMLGESFKYVAPVAGAMGYTIEDTALALGLMANAGVKSSMAGTALRRAITSLAAPTDKQATAMEKYGISLTDSEGGIKSLNEIMGDLRTNLSGLSEDEKTAAVTQMFGNQAMAGMLAVINASEKDFNKLSSAVNNADGAAQNMAETMMDNMQGSFTLMQSAIEGVEDSLGERLAPYMRSLADGITAAMPGATAAINDIMDVVDQKADHVKAKWDGMVSTQEWKNSGFAGKVNMVFDTMVAQPISKWAKTRGRTAISSAMGGLFSEALKILPGGEEAGLTSWLSAGVIAKGAVTAVKGVSALATTLSSIAPAAATVVPAIAGVAAAVGGIVIAMDALETAQANISLEKHFGNVSLSPEEIQQFAGQVLELDWVADINLALGAINDADKLREEAQAAIDRNDVLEWKSQVNITMTPANETYADALYGIVQDALTAGAGAEGSGFTYEAAAEVSLTGKMQEGYEGILAGFAQQKIDELDDSGQLQYAGEVGVQLTPEEEDTILDALLSQINADLAAEAEAAGLEYTGDVKTSLTPEMEESMRSLVQDYINNSVSNAAGGSDDALTFEDHVKVKLTPEEQAEYKDNIDTFIKNKFTELEDRTYAANIMVQTILSESEEGQSMADQIKEWASIDTLEMEGLSSQLSQAVEDALIDGVISVDEQAVINELQNKINAILSGWDAAQAETSMDMIRQKYGKLTGAQLEAGAMSDLVAEMQAQREESEQAIDSASREFYNMVNGQKNRGRLTDEQAETWKTNWQEGIRNQRANTLTNGVGFYNQTLNDAYADAIGNYTQGDASSLIDYLGSWTSRNDDGSYNWADPEKDMNRMLDAFENNASAFYNGKADKGLSKMYDQMKPDITAMGDIIDEYAEAGQAVPKALMDSYNEAMAIGAAAGDYDAGWYQMAKSIMDSGEQGLVDEIMNGNLGGDELRSAMEKAIQNATATDDPIELEDLKAELKGLELDEDNVGMILSEAEQKAIEKIAADTGGEFKIDGGEAYVEWHIDEGQTLSQISEATGVAMDKIAEMNGIEDVNVISAGATIKIPADSITVDTSEISGAAAGESVDVGDVDATATANTAVEAGETDASAAYETAAADTQTAFDTTMEVDGSANATLDQTNNADEVYSGVSSDVQSKFNSAISASGTVNVTLAWHITNPTASISVGTSGGTATATISSAGMANGGFVDGAMLSLVGEDGPEFVVPVGSKRRNRGIELWAKAGEALGMFDSIPAYADGGLIGGDEDDFLSTPFEKKKETSNNVWEGLFGSDPNNSTPNAIEGLLAATGSPQSDNNATTNGVNVNVSMSPVIQIEGSGMNEDEVFGVMKRRIKEVADDVGMEVGEKLMKIFSNMPLAAEV